MIPGANPPFPPKLIPRSEARELYPHPSQLCRLLTSIDPQCELVMVFAFSFAILLLSTHHNRSIFRHPLFVLDRGQRHYQLRRIQRFPVLIQSAHAPRSPVRAWSLRTAFLTLAPQLLVFALVGPPALRAPVLEDKHVLRVVLRFLLQRPSILYWRLWARPLRPHCCPGRVSH